MVHGGNGAPDGQVISDYRSFDLEGLWANRDPQTRLESEIIDSMLNGEVYGRVLDVGIGFGRLSQPVARHCREYVALDLDAVRLHRAREHLSRLDPPAAACRWIQANLLCPPLESGSVDGLTAFRVLHHFKNLHAVLASLAALLRPGGVALVSYAPRPTVGTLFQDLHQPSRGDEKRRTGAVTFAGRGMVQAASGPFPVFTCDRATFDEALRYAGLSPIAEVGAPENVRRWARRPARGLGELCPRIPLLAQTFVLAGKPATGSRDGAPTVLKIACPACRQPVTEASDLSGEWEQPCPSCGFRFRFRDDILRAVYFPPGTRNVTAQTAGSSNDPNAAV